VPLLMVVVEVVVDSLVEIRRPAKQGLGCGLTAISAVKVFVKFAP